MTQIGASREGVDIQSCASPELTDPVLVEGLPGVGNVGKLVVEHLLEEGEATLVCRILSEHFPPQVTVDRASTATLPAAEIHHVTIGDCDLLTLSGDHQAVTPMGHYRLTSAVLDIAAEFAVERVFALGGVPTGEMQETPAVIGTVSRAEIKSELEPLGVEFREQEPSGGIVGVSGLLLGIGAERDLDVACLMGETSGYLVDPTSAQAILRILEDAIDFSVEYERLESRAEDMEQVIRRLREMQESSVPSGDDLRYID